MATLYEISKAIENCFIINDEIIADVETGEVLDKSYLDNLQMEKKEKIENIACYIKNLKAEADACKAEADAFKKREKHAKNKIESLQNYLSCWISGEKIDTKRCQIRWRKSKQIIITDQNLIPDKYKEIIKEVKINKTEIKNSLKNGVEVQGASLIEKQNIQVK